MVSLYSCRSLPGLELVKENSLTSVLRWNFKANVEWTMSSTDSGHITLVNMFTYIKIF